jgi:Holliday junction resolvasome RuvABC endonuclease subunit
MKYIGIDYGVRTAHIAVLNADSYYVTTVMVAKTHRQRELEELHSLVKAVLHVEGKALVYVESPVLAGVRNLQVLISMSQAHSQILTAALPSIVESVAVASWKKAIVGKGNATKAEVAAYLKLYYPDLHDQCKSQDHIDATCIALYGKQSLENP